MLAVGLFEVGNGLNTRTRLFWVSATYKLVPSEVTPWGESKPCAVGESVPCEVKSGCPTTTSAGAPLVVGMVFQIRTRWLFSSATTSLVPSLQSSSGWLRLVWLASSVLLVKSGWPTTTSASAPLVVGMLFQIMIRLLFRSATRSLPPATTNPTSGLSNPDWVVVPSLETRSGWPTARLAGVLVLTGSLFQMSTRL